MTHDEIISDLNKYVMLVEAMGMPATAKMAAIIRVVAELHKPIKDEWFNPGEIICEECTREEYTQKYPCPTIQAIEKELG